jgi:hypothetical protein
MYVVTSASFRKLILFFVVSDTAQNILVTGVSNTMTSLQSKFYHLRHCTKYTHIHEKHTIYTHIIIQHIFYNVTGHPYNTRNNYAPLDASIDK